MTIQLAPYITLEGQAKAAVQFYQQSLGAELISIATYGDMPGIPESVAEERRELVAHARLKIGETELMLSDSPGGTMSPGGSKVSLCITAKEIDQARRIYEVLQQGGEVQYPFQREPFSPGFGVVTDRFGITFQIVTQA